VMAVVAAIGVGRLLSKTPRWAGPGGWAGAALAVTIIAALVPAASSRVRAERADLIVQRARTVQINRLATAVRKVGGAASVRMCGEPLTQLAFQTVVAWTIHRNVASIGWKLAPAMRAQRPTIIFFPHGHGWRVASFHQRTAACRGLGARA
jgi:hypothetical protein